MKIMSIFGTRPEAIKMCPLIKKMEQNDQIKSFVCLTGQHKEMLNQVMEIFQVRADYNLNIMQVEQTLTTITVNVLTEIDTVLQKERPDLVLVHGDTTTSFVAALAAFYKQIPVGHVEAGLRTYNKYSPFPEEINRNLTSRIAELHFVPTIRNKQNLEKENIYKNLFITGNTVIDALKMTIKENYVFKNSDLKAVKFQNKKCVLVTAHRRENWGKPIENICRALLEIVNRYHDVIVIYPVHMNPVVKKSVYSILSDKKQIYLLEPLDVEDMHNLMNRSYLIITDSGGIQEEAPSCGVPVIVARTETERPEAVDAGTVKVVGVKEKAIYDEIVKLIEQKKYYDMMSQAINPYGDGKASERIVSNILEWYQQKMK